MSLIKCDFQKGWALFFGFPCSTKSVFPCPLVTRDIVIVLLLTHFSAILSSLNLRPRGCHRSSAGAVSN